MMPVKSASFLVGLLALADAHRSLAVGRESCSCQPGSRPAESYHIHVMFFTPDNPAGVPPGDPAGNNPNNMQNAAALRTTFMQQFNISDCPPTGPGRDPTVLCAYEVDPATGAQPFPAIQPFVTPEFAFFVPVDRYTDAVGWMMIHRGVFDVFVHPNTCGWSCAVQDHLLNSLWMGTPWKVKFQLPSQASLAAPAAPSALDEEIVVGSVLPAAVNSDVANPLLGPAILLACALVASLVLNGLCLWSHVVTSARAKTTPKMAAPRTGCSEDPAHVSPSPRF